ncbi:MAG TPA: glycosyltransferase family 39 protein, partial [candidate division Zixibacteria bacterium]|nr:glycosyltransferase family 39 protein [candidate division Zixibacteria bacterium]
MTEKRWLVLILVLFTVLGITYAATTPIFEASDELWHYPMVKHLADGNPLPVQVFDPDLAGPWKQEASQPPLYYYLGAALTFWIDTSDMDAVRWLNPHVDNGVITRDGNINLVVHNPAKTSWQGTSLAIRIVRIFSVLLGAATVYLTYRIAKEVAPNRPEVYLGAAAVNAFIPMFLFISGAVNNDNLVIMLASLSLLLTIKLAVNPTGQISRNREIWNLILLGVVIGLGALTKISALGLIPLALAGVVIGQWRTNKEETGINLVLVILRQTLWRFAVLLVPVLLIAGWWYLRNIQLYDDWSGWNAFIAVLGKRATPANLAQLWDERWGFMLSYWGLFGGLNVPMVEWIYRLLNNLAVISAIGFVAYSAGLIVSWWSAGSRRGKRARDILSNIFDFVSDNFALIVCVLWTAAIIFGLVRWATVTWSSQGRLVFSSISALCTIFVLGLIGWMPRSIGKGVIVAISGVLFIVSALAPFIWITPSYEPSSAETTDLRIVDRQFGNSILLEGYSTGADSVEPGDSLEVNIQWEVLRAMNRDWSVFIHLNDPETQLPAAQRDMYPGQGLLATSLLSTDDRFVDQYILNVPETAITPSELELTIGFYDFQSGERLTTDNGRDSEVLTKISLRSRPGDIPNPLSINFENTFELVGFSIEPRRLSAGESLELKLFYISLGEVNEDYTFFVQLVG